MQELLQQVAVDAANTTQPMRDDRSLIQQATCRARASQEKPPLRYVHLYHDIVLYYAYDVNRDGLCLIETFL